ncbi:MAG: leucyl/phenylalanyl-tRNA--protein transferase [Rhodobacteraceae bacterium]|nr:leucyl/phenylalanyl-tRNA--protein transferase [Paracoccaceae bacterium]
MAADTLPPITPELLLHAYRLGVFPMSEGGHDDEVFWVEPERRGILPLDGFHISRSLARAIRKADYRIHVDTDFAAVLDACADRPETWINPEIRALYLDLHRMGYAHSLEVRDEQGVLIGGVYGVAIGGAFFGESMFSRRTNASKIALAYLVDHLRLGGFQLLDTQFITDHLLSLGALEISREDYLHRLALAIDANAEFRTQLPLVSTPGGILQRNTQTS